MVYFNGIASIEQLNQIRPALLKQIKKQVDEYTDWRPAVVTLDKVKRYLVKYFLTKGSGEDKVTHEVDILPAFDVLKRKYFATAVCCLVRSRIYQCVFYYIIAQDLYINKIKQRHGK